MSILIQLIPEECGPRGIWLYTYNLIYIIFNFYNIIHHGGGFEMKNDITGMISITKYNFTNMLYTFMTG